MVFTIPSLGSKRAHFNVDQDGMATTRVSHRSMHHFVNLVQKDLLTRVQNLLYALRKTIIQGVHKVNIPWKQVLYTQNNVFHVHLVHILLKLNKFILAPADVVWGNILRAKD